MSDEIEDGNGAKEQPSTAEPPQDSDAARRRSKLEELARWRAEHAPDTADAKQEVLPPEGEGRGKLRELLGQRLGRRGGGLGRAGEGAGGRRGAGLGRAEEGIGGRRGGGLGRAEEGAGGRRGEFLRRVLENRRGDGGGGNPSRREVELEERVRRLEDELDRLRDRDRDDPGPRWRRR